MNNNITTYKDLLEERQRLTLLLEERRILVKTEFEDIKTKLKPVSEVVEVLGKFTTKDRSNPLMNFGIDLGVNLVLKKLLLRNAGFLMKLIVPALTKNFLSHETEETKNVFSRIGRFFGKKIKSALN